MSDMLDDALDQMDERIGYEAPVEEADTVTEEAGADEPVEEQASVEAPDEPGQPDEQPRDPETGQFLPKEGQTVQERLLAGKYKSPEELERAYEELQSRMGQQGSELGQLRETLEKLNTNLEPKPEPVRIDSDAFDEAIDRNPQAAAEWAAKHDPDGPYFEKAMEAWYELYPRQAARYEMEQREKKLREEFGSQLQETTRPLADQATHFGIEQAVEVASAQIPDFEEVAPYLQQAGEFAPELVRGLQSPDPAERVKSITKLAYLARGMVGTQNAAQTAEAKAAQKETAKSVKLDGGSVATQTQVQDPEQVGESEQWARDFLDPILDRHDPQSE